MCWAVRFTAGVQHCRCVACDSSVHNLQAASHSASQICCILLGLPLFLSSTPIHPRSRTLMPFSSVSHVTKADMNFRGTRDPITAEGCLSRTHHFESVPSIKRGMGNVGWCMFAGPQEWHCLVISGRQRPG